MDVVCAFAITAPSIRGQSPGESAKALFHAIFEFVLSAVILFFEFCLPSTLFTLFSLWLRLFQQTCCGLERNFQEFVALEITYFVFKNLFLLLSIYY